MKQKLSGIFKAIIANLMIFVFFIGIFGTPTMIGVLLYEKLILIGKDNADWAIIITSIVSSLCMACVLWKAKLNWGGK